MKSFQLSAMAAMGVSLIAGCQTALSGIGNPKALPGQDTKGGSTSSQALPGASLANPDQGASALKTTPPATIAGDIASSRGKGAVDTAIRGWAVFPSTRRAQAVDLSTLPQSATVAVRSLADGTTLAGGSTDNFGAFTLNPGPGFNAALVPGACFLLDVMKRPSIPASAVGLGSNLLVISTILMWQPPLPPPPGGGPGGNFPGWGSITNGGTSTPSYPIVVSPLTSTAVMALGKEGGITVNNPAMNPSNLPIVAGQAIGMVLPANLSDPNPIPSTFTNTILPGPWVAAASPGASNNTGVTMTGFNAVEGWLSNNLISDTDVWSSVVGPPPNFNQQ